MNQTTLTETIQHLRSGKWSLMAYIDQIETHYAAREPEVLAFVPEAGRFDRLRREAQVLLTRYPDPEQRPPLFGLLMGIKDIFQVDGLETKAGSKLPPALLRGQQAASVTLARQAGALIMGKTVTTEFAYFGPGPTRNPHNLAHTPGGSSSGSAAAVAANLVPITLGTQTIGSVNRPAAFCGVVGYKPSYNRIDKSGVIPLSLSLDHVGIFANDVAAAALVAAVLCQQWVAGETDLNARPILAVPEGSYLQHAEAEGIAHYKAACDRLVAAGYTIKSVPALADFEDIRRKHSLLVAAEAAEFHADWFAEYGHLYHYKTAELVKEGQTYDQTAVTEARQARLDLRQDLQALMDTHQFDLWLTPSAPGPAPEGLASTGDPVMNLPWTNSGLPTLTLPAGFSQNGLPLAVQLVGRWYGDEALFAQGALVEASLAEIDGR